MKHIIPLTALFILMSCGEKNTETVNNPAKIKSPVATIKPHEMKIHGDTRIDNYFWMNERDSPEVKVLRRRKRLYKRKNGAYRNLSKKSI